MILINIKRNQNNQIIYLEASGHANYDDYGKDIICSAVSAILVGGLNAIENIKSYNVKIENGYILVELLKENIQSNKDSIVFETLYYQLKTIEKNYNKFIKIYEWKDDYYGIKIWTWFTIIRFPQRCW